MWNFDDIKQIFKGRKEILLKGKYGIEKESQRIDKKGKLALTPHPELFGDKMENKEVTVDFAESHIEMITQPCATVEEVYTKMAAIVEYVEKNIGAEKLWPFSMPPVLPLEREIPIAKFSDDEVGRQKEVYRMGLAARYGKKMQMISGIHYNFSFADELFKILYGRYGNNINFHAFKDDVYLRVTRNYLRYRWLLIYLFGASPVYHSTYKSVIKNELKRIKECCPCCCEDIKTYEKSAISLRVSRFGYRDNLQEDEAVYFNSLHEYIKKIKHLMQKKSEKYADLGICKDGRRIQLNVNVLQKESEFYSPIRLKRIDKESQMEALEKRGIEYLEVRILDVNPYEKSGVTLNELRFMQVFMLFCLFEESPMLHREEYDRITKNHNLTALKGRSKTIRLCDDNDTEKTIKEMADKIFDKLQVVAGLIGCEQKTDYLAVVEKEYEKILNPKQLLSEKIYQQTKKNGYIKGGMKCI